MTRVRTSFRRVVTGTALLWALPALLGAASPPAAERIEVGPQGRSIQEEPPPAETYTYIPGERRDPFISLLQRGGDQPSYGDELTPLQRVEVGELNLVGIVKNPQGYTALIQTPDGRGYFLREGTAVGKNEGVVEKILEDRVIVKEKKADFLGQIRVSEFVLTLKKKEEGKR